MQCLGTRSLVLRLRDEWVGGSHNSNIAGTVRHSFKWIKNACNERKLTVKRLKGEKINTQHLILIEKSKL